MESVEDWTLEEALERKGEVLHGEYEGIIVDQRAQTYPVVFKFHGVVMEIEFVIFCHEH